jgi:hypothetical protein
MSNWSEEVYETLTRLDANVNSEKKSLAASVTVPENDKLCASLIEKSLAASVRANNNNEAMEIYTSIFGVG